MGGAQTGSGVAMELRVERDQILKRKFSLQKLTVFEDGTTQKQSVQSRDELRGDFAKAQEET